MINNVNCNFLSLMFEHRPRFFRPDMHPSKTNPFYLIIPPHINHITHTSQPNLSTQPSNISNSNHPNTRPSITSPSPPHSNHPSPPLKIPNHLTENFSLPKSTNFNQFSLLFQAHPTFSPKNSQPTQNQPINPKSTNFSALLIQRPLY